MPFDPANARPWEQKLREAGETIESEVRRLATYINDEIVPDVRRNGSEALRAVAAELERLAHRVDEAQKTPPPPGVPKP